MVFDAHKPHPKGYKTFFGYFKDDGFNKSKHLGRIDNKEKWATIKSRWLDAYMNHEQSSMLSVLQTVTPKDEWCAEAYMETDYSNLTEDYFIETVKNYVAYKFLRGH